MCNGLILLIYHVSFGRTGIRFIADSVTAPRRLLRSAHAIKFLQIRYGFHCCVENGFDRVDLCRPWNESQRPVLPWCCQRSSMLQAIHFVFQQDNAASRRARDTTKLLQQETLDFIGPNFWSPNSSDLISMDYEQRLYECRMNSVHELKQRLIELWNSLQQNVIDAAINEWRKRLRACVRADGQHFEQLLWAHMTDKSYGQI